MEQVNTILIVDDQPFGRETLAALLVNQGYNLAFARNGPEALSQAATLTPDLILLDVMMPGMDGFEVCQRLRSDSVLSHVPVIMVTALEDQESRVHGIEAGADDFISKPFNRTELRARIGTIIRLNRYRRLLEEQAKFERVIELSPDGLLIVGPDHTILLANPAMRAMLGVEPEQADTVVGTSLQSILVPDQHECSLNCLKNIITADTTSHVVGFETMMVRLDTSTFPVEVTCGQIVWDGTLATQITVRDITERKHAEEEVKRSREELAQAYDATLAGWSKALEIRDKETEGHSQRVTDMTVRIARAMGICGEDLEHVRRGAILHDIGKMGIPDSILLKNGPLTDEEWVIMRQHPVYAYEWLRPITYLHPSLDIPYCHHEKWDGTGYPRGLSGEDIPLSARIFAVVDVWDALSYDRPYRSAWPQEKVRQHIRTLSGTHFDPDVVDVFFSLLD